jgi:hydroxyacid-oxoacid transhydrogenase
MGPVCPERHAESARALGVIAEVYKEPWEALENGNIGIMRALDVPNGLSGLGYTVDDLAALTEKGWPQRRVVDNAARLITKEEMRSIFAEAISYWRNRPLQE